MDKSWIAPTSALRDLICASSEIQESHKPPSPFALLVAPPPLPPLLACNFACSDARSASPSSVIRRVFDLSALASLKEALSLEISCAHARQRKKCASQSHLMQ